jgi:phage-related protein
MEQMPAIQELGRNFGQWLGGLAERLPEIIGKIKEFGSWVKDTVTGVKDFVGGWENLAKILAGLAITPTFISGLKVVWSLAKFIKIAIAALPLILAGLKVGFAAIAAAAWPIVAIIAGIALVIYTVVKNFDILKQYALDCIERIKAAFGGATGGIAVDWQKVGETAKNVLGIIMSILEGGVLYAIKTVMNAITSAIQSVIGAFKVLWNVAKLIFWPIETIIKVIVGLFTGGWSGAMDAVGGQVAKLGEIFKGIFDGIKIMVGAVADFFKGQFQNAFELINRILGNFGISTESIFEGIAFAVSAAGNFIKNIFGGIGEFFSGVGDSFKNTWSGAVGFVTGIIDGLGGFFRFVFDGVTETIRTVADFIKEIFIDPVNTVKNLVGGIADVFTGIFDAGKEKVQAFVGFFTDKFKVVGDIIGGIGGFFGSIGEKIGNVFGGKGKGADIPGHAAGGIFKQRHIAEIAEKGAEAVVPLNNTSQGFDIWKQAGELGGYLKKASEQAPAISAAAAASSGKTPEPSPVMAAASQKISSGDTAVRIDFKMTNNFNGGTPDGETVKQIAESGQKAGEDFRSKVESIFESMMRDRRRVSYG